MRYILMIIGAAVVTYFLIMGIRAFVSERSQKDTKDNSNP